MAKVLKTMKKAAEAAADMLPDLPIAGGDADEIRKLRKRVKRLEEILASMGHAVEGDEA